MEKNLHSLQDADSPWGQRVPVAIDPETGFMSAGEASRPVDLDGDVSVALSSYLSMVYELRSMSTGVISLRHEDLQALADAFEMEETDIAEKLARLMHCDDLQTRRFVQMVKKGRVLVPVSMVAAGALLAATLAFSSPSVPSNSQVQSQSRANVEIAPPTSTENTAVVGVTLGEGQQVERAVVTNDAVEVEDSSASSDTVEDGVVEEAAAAPSAGALEDAEPEVIIGEGIHVSRD
jgi:hypothetical protein